MFGTGISLYYLEIGILGTFLLTFAEKSGTDLAGIPPASVFFFYMDRIDPDIIPVKEEKVIQRIYSRVLFFEEKENLSISKKIRKIMDIMRDGEEFFLEEAKGVLAALLVEIARLNRDSGEDKVAEDAGKLTNMITRVLDYVSYHYMEDIKVEDLANICHISETHFRRVFTSYMKVSPLEYINTVRVYTACELLETTEDPVADIAHKCGFTTNSTFNRNFKQLMGVTPLEWRKRPESYEQQLLRFDIHSEKGW